VKNKIKLSGFLINAGLLVSGALLFSLGFPNFIYDWGFAPLAWVSLVPVLLLIRRLKWWSAPLWGAVYGYTAYSILNFWLATFNPVSFVLVPSIYAGWYFMLFLLLYLLDRSFPKFGWLAQLLLWAVFDIIRSRGFIGYPYGNLGYTQYNWKSLIAISDIFGVMGVMLLVAFPSFLLAGYLLELGVGSDPVKLINSEIKNKIKKKPPVKWLAAASIWIVLMISANIYGVISKVDYSESKTWRPALVQHNVNTWLSGIDAWREALDYLIEESDKALEQKPDAVIWSETSFVPAVEWHEKYRPERDRLDLIHKLKDYLKDKNIPFFIGNNDAVQDAGRRKDYNAVLLFDKDKIIQKYHKIHLVPFSEHFPYAKMFPWLMDYIESQDTPLYHAGDEFTVFSLDKWNGPRVSTLICFEDIFGDLAQNFTAEGAQVLVNLSNDSWSTSAVCAIQHQNMALFRAVENRRTFVRATTSGITCTIDPNGKVLGMLKPYTRDVLVMDVPVYTGRTTIYTKYGNWFDKFLLILIIPVLTAAVLLSIYRTALRRRNQKENQNNKRRTANYGRKKIRK